MKEHTEIYQYIADIRADDNNAEQLVVFADALDRHIRFEERVLFNHLQSKLSDAELTKLALEHPERVVDTDSKWDDHFWLIK
jgi:hemerythrin-like domain-containing protein